MKKLSVLKLTRTQLSTIRKALDNNGYPLGCGLKGRNFYLLTQPVIDYARLDIVLLTEKEGLKVSKLFKKLKEVK
jgi:hypothetical protein